MQTIQTSPIIERLKNLYFLPGEIALLKDDINKLQGIGDPPVCEETITIETQRLNRCVEEMHALTNLIDGVDDLMLRQVLTLRFAAGHDWPRVALELGGNPATYRKMVYRWAQKMEVNKYA